MNTQKTKYMKAAQFKEQLRKLQDKKFYGLTNQQVYSYIRIYYSVYMMITVNALDSEYGDRKIYISKMRSLLKILLRRYKNETSLPEKMQQLYMIFFLLDNTTCSYDCEEYLNRGADLIDEFLANNKDTMTSEEQYQLMRLIFIEWYGLIEDDETDTPASLTYAREQIKQWAAALTSEGTWHNLDDRKALRRIVLIAMNSTVMLDDQYDEKLQQAYAHYCMQPIATTNKQSTEELEKNIEIYYALQRAPLAFAGNYTTQLTKLADIIGAQITHQKNNSTLQTRCKCIHADNMCQKISDEIQERLMGEI